jgi:AraC-like DNA-binding protein
MIERSSSPLTVKLPDHGFLVLESHHSADFTMPEDSWPFHKLCMVGAGKGRIEHRGTRYPLKAGALVLLPSKLPHRFVDDPNDPLTLVLFCVSPENVFGTTKEGELFYRLLELCPFPGLLSPSRHVQEKVREALRVVLIEQRMQKAGWRCAVHGVWLELMVYLVRVIPLRDQNNRDDLFQLSVVHIETHFFERISTSDMAALCGVSERTYSGMFKQRMGMTVTEFILACRIDHAKERLRETGNISYAALESGFPDLAHFYRMFKRSVGMPPGQFIEEERPKISRK